MEHGEKVLWLLRWQERHGAKSQENLTTYTILRELGIYMPRKKGSTNATERNSRFNSSGTVERNELKWLNIKLEPDDIVALEQSDATFEYLAASVVGLGNDGIGISIKTLDQGETHCVTLIGSDGTSDSLSFGISSFAGNLRDALLVALYKFDEKLGGDFTNAAHFVSNQKQGSRFR